MKGAEVRKMAADELDEMLTNLRRRLYDLRCQAGTEKIENPSEFAKVRKDVARLLTERQARATAKGGGK